MWRSLVARFVRDEEAVGSNPATPTRKRLVKAVFVHYAVCCSVPGTFSPSDSLSLSVIDGLSAAVRCWSSTFASASRSESNRSA